MVALEEKPEPEAYQCNDCGEWSAYRIFDGKLPRTWAEDEKGYHCNKCRKNKKGK